jgi:hypothetical protein
MPPPVLIARIVGPVLVVIGAGVLLNLPLYVDMVGEAVRMPVLIYLSGLLALTAGVAMLNAYRAWTADWRVIVTIMGWLLVLGGIVRIAVPRLTVALATTIYSGPAAMAVVGIAAFLLGGFLSFKAYRQP